MAFDVQKFDVQKFNRILARGLSVGLGERGKRVCIEAAICETLGLPHGDDPQCADIHPVVRRYKIRLNDAQWSSPRARAEGLRALGLAQLGSNGVVDGSVFTAKVLERMIREIVPSLFLKAFPDDRPCLDAAIRCEQEGTRTSAIDAWAIAVRVSDFSPLHCRTEFGIKWMAAHVALALSSNATASAVAKTAYFMGDTYLVQSAEIALDVLKELKSPGTVLL